MGREEEMREGKKAFPIYKLIKYYIHTKPYLSNNSLKIIMNHVKYTKLLTNTLPVQEVMNNSWYKQVV